MARTGRRRHLGRSILCVGPVLALTAGVLVQGAPGAVEGEGAFVPAPLPSSSHLHQLHSGTTRNVEVIGSLNWAGYVQASRPRIFTSVKDTWTVPTVSTTAGTQYSSDWVGIGGFGSRKLVQAGTEADNVNGRAFYQAWTEVLPASEDPLSMTIHAGDAITTLVQEVGANTWLMQVSDTTTRVTQSRTVSYASPGRSAEAIHERPCLGSPCSLATLASTSNVTFDPGTFTSKVQTTPQPLLYPALQSEKRTKKGLKTTSDELYRVAMVQSSSASSSVLATPSAPGADNDGFAVADGATAPAPPTS